MNVAGPKRAIALAVSSALFSGYLRPASGTWGTAAAVLFYLPLASWNRPPSAGGAPALFALALVLTTAIAIWSSDVAEGIHGKKDPSRVVIDEVAGFFVTMTLVPFTWLWIGVAFLAFRVFDVLKPPPAYRLQSLKGGFGIVVDDLLAGVYACIAVHAIRWIAGAPLQGEIAGMFPPLH